MRMHTNGPIMPVSIQQSLSMFGKSQPVTTNGTAVRIAAPSTWRILRPRGPFCALASTSVYILCRRK